MILFVGEQDKGWFIPETAEKKNEKCEYSGFVSSLEELSKRILQGSFSAVILHLPSLVIMDYQNIGKFCKNLMIANGNIQIIVMAEGYNINSQIVQAAIAAGVRFFMLGTNASMLKNELTDALDGKTRMLWTERRISKPSLSSSLQKTSVTGKRTRSKVALHRPEQSP